MRTSRYRPPSGPRGVDGALAPFALLPRDTMHSTFLAYASRVVAFACLVLVLGGGPLVAGELPQRDPLPSVTLAAGVFDAPSDWTATVDLPADDYGKEPAKLCFSSQAQPPLCQLIVQKIGDFAYPFQNVEELRVVELAKSRPLHGLLLVAAHRGTVDELRLVSIWSYERSRGAFVNLLPYVPLTQQGEFKVYDDGLVITANRIWAAPKEKLYSPHRFTIRALRMAGSGYRQVLEYKTTRKYRSLDDVDEIDVIRHELPTIRRLLKKSRRA